MRFHLAGRSYPIKTAGAAQRRKSSITLPMGTSSISEHPINALGL